MKQDYLIYTPHSSIDFFNKCFQLRKELYVLLRNNVLKSNKFPWQEVCLFLDCFIIMQKTLLVDKSKFDYNDSRVADLLMQIYQEKYRESINYRFEESKLYSVPNFDYLIEHLQEELKLGSAIKFLIDEIQNRQNRFENYNHNNIEEIFDFTNGYSPYKCLNKLTEYNTVS